MRLVNRICGILFEVTILLFLVLALIAPLHAASTEHLSLVQTIDGSHGVIAGDLTRLAIGDTLPLYRFSVNWQTPIGSAHVDSIEGNTATIHTEASEMRYPLGAQGTLHAEGEKVFLSLGNIDGMEKRQLLTVFNDGRAVGRVRIMETEPHRSEVGVSENMGNLDSLVVGSFVARTEAVRFDSMIVTTVEIAFILGSLVVYAVLYLLKRRSPFLLFGEWIYRLPIPLPAQAGRAFYWLINILMGIPFVWFMGTMSSRLASYILNLAQHQTLISFDPYLPYIWGILAALYYGYLLWRRKSPVLAFWQLISYKKVGVIKEVSWKRGIVMWTLHLAIVYVFARTLVTFFFADLAAAQLIGYPHSMEEFFAVSKYIIWTLTVVGCLLGYGYSVVSILWGKFIRNLDFTVTGWLTNAFCYPLLGVVIWHMVPSFTGPSPIITAGPAFYLMLVLGFVLNLLYMLSIWNLGTMFDLMADKGVRTVGFYSVIRHPNYMLEACMFFATELVGLTTGTEWLVTLMFFFIYWIRSEREDNFMTYSNPDYTPYRQATPYKFIPGIY